jgi:hypothetical protein
MGRNAEVYDVPDFVPENGVLSVKVGLQELFGNPKVKAVASENKSSGVAPCRSEVSGAPHLHAHLRSEVGAALLLGLPQPKGEQLLDGLGALCYNYGHLITSEKSMRMWEGEDAVELSREGVEVWAPVADCPERYWVSNLGRVFSNARGRSEFLKHTITTAGYPSVGIYVRRGEQADTRLVHRMVVLEFLGGSPSPAHTDIRHLNGHHADVRLFNLAWGTRSENMKDVLEHRKEARVQSNPSLPTWHTDRTLDDHLRALGCRWVAEEVLSIRQVAELWECAPDKAARIVQGQTDLAVPVTVARRKKRTPAEKEMIFDLLRQGMGTSAINERLGLALTAQELYYYKTRLRS